MNIFAAFKYPIKDHRWKNKVGRGALLLVVPLIGQIVWAGYGIEIIRKVSAGEERELPDWSIGDNFAKGFVAAIAFIIYLLPNYLVTEGVINLNLGGTANAVLGIVGFLLFLIAMVRYAVTGSIISFLHLPALISILVRHFFSIVAISLLITIGTGLCFLIFAALTLGTVTALLIFFVFAYYFMMVGFWLGRLAPRIGLKPPEEVVWMAVPNQPQVTATPSSSPPKQTLPATTHRVAANLAHLENATVYEIQLPITTTFEPERAHSLIQQILTQVQDVTLAIVADHNKISWQIWDLRQSYNYNLIPQAVRDIYPLAQVTISPFEFPEFMTPFWRVTMLYEQAFDFVAPIKYVTDLTKLDPLASLVQGMSGLQKGERIVHLIHVASMLSDKAAKDAFKRITRSTANPFLDISSWEGAGRSLGELTGSLVTGERIGKYDPQYQKVYEERLYNHLLLNCYAMTQVDMLTEERMSRLASFYSGMLQFHAENAIAFSDEITDQNRFIEYEQQNHLGSAVTLLDAWMVGKDTRFKKTKAVLSTWEIASLWHLPHKAFTTKEINWQDIAMPSKELMGNQHGVIIGDRQVAGVKHPIRIHPVDRETHMYTIGKTGTGKSTFLHNCIHQDIQAGKGVGVLDAHGKLVRDILRLSIPDERIDDVVVLDIQNFDYPPPLNPLQAPGRDDNYAAGEVVSILETIEGSLPPQVANSLNAAFVTIRKETTPTVRDVIRLFRDPEYRYQFISQVEDPITQDYWEDYEQKSPGRQDELRQPIMHRMGRFYRNPVLYPILCHPKPINFEDLISQRKIVLMSLGIGEDKVPGIERRLVGVSLIKQFQMAAMSTLEGQEFFLYIDEVQDFITAPLDVILEQARKFGLRLNFANQYLGQLGKILPSVMGNTGTTVVFQVGHEDASKLSTYFEPELQKGDLEKMNKYHAAVKTRFLGNTAPAFKIATRPEPTDLFDFDLGGAEAEQREQMIRQRSQEKYTPMSKEEVLTWLKERYQVRAFTSPNDDKGVDWRVTDD